MSTELPAKRSAAGAGTARVSTAAGAGAVAVLALPPFSVLPALGAFTILYAM